MNLNKFGLQMKTDVDRSGFGFKIPRSRLKVFDVY